MPEQNRAVRTSTIVIVILAFVALPFVTWLASFATDYLWFVDLGQRGVFVTMLVSEIATGVAFGIVAFALLFVNLRVARAMAPRAVLTSVGDLPPQFEEAIINMRAKAGPFADRIILWGSAGAAFLVGLAMAGYWDTMRLALASTTFGLTDPQYGKDVGYYVFSLPALRIVADWLPAMLVVTTLATAVVHVLDGSIQPWARLKGFAPHVKVHLSVLLGLIVASKAFDYYLKIYELNFSPRGQVAGASYTDVHAQLPALRILMVIAGASALALMINVRFKGWRLPLAALGLWIGASVIVGSIYPALIQQFRVAPNEVAAEAPYIERNIQFTRKAFGLDEIETRAFPASEDLTAEDVVSNADTLDNVRLWDPSIVTQSYRQLQVIRPYYDFKDVDIDRYMIDGKQQQVLVSAREMDVNQLADQARTWVNQHLVYTHGYGLVMSRVNEADTRGLPKFIVRDIPPVSDGGLDVSQPSIYFGEHTTDYVVVNTDIKEFDYPVGDENAEATYEGAAGVKVGSLPRRVAFALRFGASQILFSRYITPESRVLFDRDITTRIAKLAPWLWLDDDPYPVLANGRIVWVLDGYTWSNRYPYSQPISGLNYMRNSVKVTIDAYDGTTTLYAFDDTDPVLQAWRKVFPDLLVDGDKIPEEIREHFRYPEGLFSVQAEVYKNYHMTNPQVFYNKEDSWELPGVKAEGGAMQPFYVLMRLPGEKTEDFQMIMPFTPRNRDNMIGWMAAKSDPAEYGKRIVYQFPKQRVILGPEQISARINQDETISPQLTLWSQRGSQVIFGNMLVIPLNDSIVYIQPLYLQAEQTAIPELTRVLVVYADKIEMAPDLKQALLQVFGKEAPQDTGGGAEETVDAATARNLYEQAIEAQKSGDWAEYGRLIEQLGAVLERLAKPSGVVTPTVQP
ncbi:MAG: UPF0182 family protein [Actinomycetota bacterium]|nr:UPF0182 family protein [Actinomycetota bacterium]